VLLTLRREETTVVTVEQVHSEIVVEGEATGGREEAMPQEVRLEELRPLVRELIGEALEHYLRTEARC